MARSILPRPIAVEFKCVPKLLCRIFSTLSAISLLLLIATAGMWTLANSGYGTRALCIATPGATIWRIRLDNPLLGRISRFKNWPSFHPPRFAMKYVTAAAQSPINAYIPPGVDFTPSHQTFEGDNFSCLSGPASVPVNSSRSPPRWDSPIILVMQSNPYTPVAPNPPANSSLMMISYSYVWAMEVFCVLPLIKLLLMIRRAAIRNAEPTPGFCANCGYDLRATPDRCPECGAVPRNRPDASPS